VLAEVVRAVDRLTSGTAVCPKRTARLIWKRRSPTSNNGFPLIRTEEELLYLLRRREVSPQ
jgi:hypothetical protein